MSRILYISSSCILLSVTFRLVVINCMLTFFYFPVMKLMNVDLAGEQGATLRGVPVDNVGSKFNEITIPILTLKQIGRRKNKSRDDVLNCY